VTEAFDAIYARRFDEVWEILDRVGILRPEEQEEVAQNVFCAVHVHLKARRPILDERKFVATLAWRIGVKHQMLKSTRCEPRAMPARL
jgi:hypothetical protein